MRLMSGQLPRKHWKPLPSPMFTSLHVVCPTQHSSSTLTPRLWTSASTVRQSAFASSLYCFALELTLTSIRNELIMLQFCRTTIEIISRIFLSLSSLFEADKNLFVSLSAENLIMFFLDPLQEKCI
jgi:hypothetical protein